MKTKSNFEKLARNPLFARPPGPDEIASLHESESSKSALKVLRMRDLTAEYGLKPATVYRWISEGAFPLPINLGANAVAWHREEIEAWLRSRPRAKVKVRTQ